MYASIDFATKRDFRRAVREGLPVVIYSPTLGMPAINGRVTVTGPWPIDRTRKAVEPAIGPKEKRTRHGAMAWMAHVDVKDMRIIAVH